MNRGCNNDAQAQATRIKFIVFICLIFFAIGVGRIFYLMINKNAYYTEAAASQRWSEDTIYPERGRILVRDDITGELFPLADNRELSQVAATPGEIKDIESVADRLAPVIGVSRERIKSLIENNKTHVVLRNGLSFEAAEKVKSFNLEGIHISSKSSRYYPEGKLASQVIGFVNYKGEGEYGIEARYQEYLAGTSGFYNSERDPTGRRIAFGNKAFKDAVDGKDIVLTINRDVQAEAERLLEAQVERFSAEGGSLIVMNPENGEILAMANAPSFDPNFFWEAKDYSLFLNPSVHKLFEPGSIFKVLTVAAAVDAGKVEPDTKYNDTGSITLGGHKIMNSNRKANGWVTVTQILERSLNTGTTFLMQQLGMDSFFDYIKKFGFGGKTGIELDGEESGLVHDPDSVNEHTYATISFGQSITVTPIQMISSIAAIANGGELVPPTLVYEKIAPNGERTRTERKDSKRIISSEAATKVRQMMVSTIEQGHGQQARVDGYRIAGKTGTAQVPRKDGRGYEEGKNIGSFVGFGPAESPRFVVLAKIDAPKGTPWAETTAAPIVGDMLDFLFKYYRVPPSL